jgi:Carbohydrate esterase, sialic acid-specific acetylesterase
MKTIFKCSSLCNAALIIMIDMQGARITTQPTPLFMLIGESNSVGVALNSELPPSAFSPGEKLKIWNNLTGGFESLEINRNNNLGQYPAEVARGYHGLEYSLGLAVKRPAALLKSGWSGSKVEDWTEGKAPWETFKARHNAAILKLRASRSRYKPIVIWWQGINDAMAGVNPITWATMTSAHLDKLKAVTGATTIVMPYLPGTKPEFAAYNAQISQLANQGKVIAIQTPDSGLQADLIHYSEAGFSQISRNIAIELKASMGKASGF